MAPEPGEEFAGLDNAMLGQVKMRFRLTLPVKPETLAQSSPPGERTDTGSV